MTKWRVTYQKPIEYEVLTCPDIFNPQNDALASVGKR
jgi:hypothetical protein